MARPKTVKKAVKTAKTVKATKAVKSVKSAKPAAKKAAPKAKLAPTALKAISDKQTKAQIYAELEEMSGVSKKEIKAVFASLRGLVHRHMKPKGSGEVTIPELALKVRRIDKKATKKRMGRNPFTGEEVMIPAKPARKAIKATPLKSLKTIMDTL